MCTHAHSTTHEPAGDVVRPGTRHDAARAAGPRSTTTGLLAPWPQHCGRSTVAAAPPHRERAPTRWRPETQWWRARAAGRHGGVGSGDGSSRGSTCVAMGDDTGGGAGDGGGSSTAVAVKATTCTTATCTGTTISDARTVGAERSRPCSHTSLRKLSSDAKRMITTQRRRQTVAGDLRRCGHWNMM